MADFKLPDLGENIESGEVINVLVSEGDDLSEDQPVIELETDKAVIEVPSTLSGTVSKVLVAEGDRANVGQVILTVEEVGADGGEPPGDAAAPEPAEETSEAAPAASAPEPPPAETPPASPAAASEESAPDAAGRAPPGGEPAPKLIPAAPSVRRLARRDRRRRGRGAGHRAGRAHPRGGREGPLPAAAREPRRRARTGPRGAAARLLALGRDRGRALQQRAAHHRPAHGRGLVGDPPRDPVRPGRHHRPGGLAQGLRSRGGEGRRQVDAHGSPPQGGGRGPARLPGLQRQHRHGRRADHLQELRAHRRPRWTRPGGCWCP